MTLTADDICRYVFQTIWNQIRPNILSGSDPGPNCFDTDRSGQNLVPDLGPNCLKWLSADDNVKQFVPRSGPTFCPDLIGVQTF